MSKITVFNKGTWKGGIISNPLFGQCLHPPEIGANLKWKKSSKDPKKESDFSKQKPY